MEISALPPCRICGQKASGLHYGVNSCEACKAFFRRSLGKFDTFVCNKNKTCLLPPGRRNFCSYCRFKKCVVLGMCREAIKTGRYTHEKRANDIMELKGINEWLAPEDEQPDVLQERLLKLQKEQQLITEQPELNKYRKHPKEKTQQQRMSDLEEYEATQLSVINLKLSSVGSGESLTSEGESLCNSLEINPSPVQFSSSDFSASDSLADDIDIIEKTINQILEAHKACTPYSEEFLRNLPNQEKEYMRLKEEKNEMFGSMKTISREEYRSVYETTGFDIDGRRELLEKALPHIEVSIKRSICFFRGIPGFKDITEEDQICLIKNTRYYCWNLMNRHSFNTDLGMHASIAGNVVGVEDMKKFHDTDLIHALFDVQKKIRSLNLTDEEACTFAAFCVMSEERHMLEKKEVAEKSQELLMKCLLHLFKKHHPEDKMRLTKVIDCFLYMSAQRAVITAGEERFIEDWDGLIDFPHFLYEIWTSDL